jgi:hypothetical protein
MASVLHRDWDHDRVDRLFPVTHQTTFSQQGIEVAMNTPQPKITRQDLESKFQVLQDEIQGVADQQKSKFAIGVSIASGVIILCAYAMGRKSGRKRRSVLEIRR